MGDKSLLTFKNILKTSLQILIADSLVFIPAYYGLWNLLLFMKTEAFINNFTCVYDKQAIQAMIAVFLVISILLFGYLVRVNSTCLGKRKTLIDCAYLGVNKALQFLSLCFVLCLLPMFYYAIILLLFMLTEYQDVTALLPTFSNFIQSNYEPLSKYGSIAILCISIFKNPLIFPMSIVLDTDVFSVIDESKKIVKGNLFFLYKILGIPLLFLFLLNIVFTFHTNHFIFFLNSLTFSYIFVLIFVYYHINELTK